jgi:hypothetical protein
MPADRLKHPNPEIMVVNSSGSNLALSEIQEGKANMPGIHLQNKETGDTNIYKYGKP